MLNMTHQGGEDEYPSNTMYALPRVARRSAPTRSSSTSSRRSDGHLVALHDASVERTTGVDQLDLRHDARRGPGARRRAQLRPRPRHGQRTSPTSAYPLRGVRTGREAAAARLHARRLPDPDARGGAARVPGRPDEHRDQGPQRRRPGVVRCATPTCSSRCCERVPPRPADRRLLPAGRRRPLPRGDARGPGRARDRRRRAVHRHRHRAARHGRAAGPARVQRHRRS